MFRANLADFPAEVIKKLAGIRLLVFDFDGVLTSNMVYVFEDGREAVRCTRSDGLGLARLPALGIEALILSTEKNPVVSARAKKLRITYHQGCEDKHRRLSELLAERGLDFHQAAYVGNDINDLKCLQAVGFPIVVQDAHPDVLSFAAYRTRTRGGEGAAREVCDLFHDVLSQREHRD